MIIYIVHPISDPQQVVTPQQQPKEQLVGRWLVKRTDSINEWIYNSGQEALMFAMQLASIQRPSYVRLVVNDEIKAERFLIRGGPSYFDHPLLAEFWLPELKAIASTLDLKRQRT